MPLYRPEIPLPCASLLRKRAGLRGPDHQGLAAARASGPERGRLPRPRTPEGPCARCPARAEDASSLPEAPPSWLCKGRAGGRRGRGRALALINYLRHSGAGLAPAIWLRYGRELRRRRAGESRAERKRKERKGRHTSARRKGGEAGSRGSPRQPSLALQTRRGRRRGRAGPATAPPGGRAFLPPPPRLPRFGLWRKRKWSLR